MTIKAVLYDLDGTLLPMNTESFVQIYFETLAKKMAESGFGAEVKAAMGEGMQAMLDNDGSRTNEEVMLEVFRKYFEGEKFDQINQAFMDYYKNEFAATREACRREPAAAETVEMVRNLGLKQVVATQPIFPAVATMQRVAWSGCDHSMFDRITTYENSSHAKPSLDYYREILDKQGLQPEECLMVGNNTDEDMVVTELGMKVFLLTEELLNRSGKDINQYPHGDFEDLKAYIKNIV
ncbi:MAG: HAD family hydrolase [Firmicutes bacterium]|nr:HAD family hydrolase [Bacillota bacterium]